VTKVLLTAFEPYDRWPDNSSWMSLMELTHWYDGPVELVTRRYPVNLLKMSERLRADLQAGYDFAIHVGLNLRTDGAEILPDAPAAYRSKLPLAISAQKIRDAGIPAAVSHHAGTYLCNAALYLSHHYSAAFSMRTQSLFVHVPLAPSQVARENSDAPSMSVPMTSAALAILIQSLVASAT